MFLKGEKPGGLPAVGGGGEPAGQKLPVSSLPSLRGERPDPAAGAAAPRCGTELPPGLGPGTTTTTTPGQPPRFPPERSGSPGPDGTGPKGTPGAGGRGAAGRSPVSGTRQERTRGSVDRDGPPPPAAVGPPALPCSLPRRRPGERGTGTGWDTAGPAPAGLPAPAGAPKAASFASAGRRGILLSHPSPGLRGKGQSSAAFSEPARTRSSNIAASADAPGRAAVRGARVTAEEWRRGAEGSAGSGAGTGRLPGRSGGGGPGAAPHRRAGPQLGRGSPRGSLASQKREGRGLCPPSCPPSPRPTRGRGRRVGSGCSRRFSGAGRPRGPRRTPDGGTAGGRGIRRRGENSLGTGRSPPAPTPGFRLSLPPPRGQGLPRHRQWGAEREGGGGFSPSTN